MQPLENIPPAPVRTDRLQFTVVGTPSPQGSKRGFVVGNRAVIVDQDKVGLRSWRQDVRQAALEALPAGWQTEAAFTVRLAFRVKPPKSLRKSHSGKVTSRPDLDKLVRSALDALDEAGVFRDDAQVWSLTALKRYAEPGFPPGCDVTVWADVEGQR